MLLFLVACTSSEKVISQPYHIHPTLEIQIQNSSMVIPANIGLAHEHHQVIHTHKEDGILHVESPVTRTFYLKEFFEIWGKTFNEQCIFEYCKDQTHELKVYVNGKEDTRFGDIILENDQNIKIVYTKK